MMVQVSVAFSIVEGARVVVLSFRVMGIQSVRGGNVMVGFGDGGYRSLIVASHGRWSWSGVQWVVVDQVLKVGFAKATLEGTKGSTIVYFRVAGILVAEAGSTRKVCFRESNELIMQGFRWQNQFKAASLRVEGKMRHMPSSLRPLHPRAD
ncbi:unnamed protein product [Prunus armeniaca]